MMLKRLFQKYISIKHSPSEKKTIELNIWFYFRTCVGFRSLHSHGWASAELSHKRKFVPSSHTGPFAIVASSRGRYNVLSLVMIFFVKELANYVKIRQCYST